jgi:hypothetical protein
MGKPDDFSKLQKVPFAPPPLCGGRVVLSVEFTDYPKKALLLSKDVLYLPDESG